VVFHLLLANVYIDVIVKDPSLSFEDYDSEIKFIAPL
jgi:hypothetical protein